MSVNSSCKIVPQIWPAKILSRRNVVHTFLWHGLGSCMVIIMLFRNLRVADALRSFIPEVARSYSKIVCFFVRCSFLAVVGDSLRRCQNADIFANTCGCHRNAVVFSPSESVLIRHSSNTLSGGFIDVGLYLMSLWEENLYIFFLRQRSVRFPKIMKPFRVIEDVVFPTADGETYLCNTTDRLFIT